MRKRRPIFVNATASSQAHLARRRAAAARVALTSPTACTREDYDETVSFCARAAVLSTVVIGAIQLSLGWEPDLAFVGLPGPIQLPLLPLVLFAFFLVWTFYGHTVSAGVSAAAVIAPVRLWVRRLADLVVRTLRARRPPRRPALRRARVAHTVDPAVRLPRSGLPFLLFAFTSSLRIP